MDISDETSSKAKQITACKSMKNSPEGSSSSKVETMNENQQEAEVTKSQRLSDDGSSDKESSDDGSSDEESSDEESSDDGSSDEESSDEESSDDGSSDKESSDDGSSDKESSDDGSSDEETSQSPKKGRFKQASKEVNLNRYRDLYLAALEGNWKDAEKIIYKNPVALTAKISMLSRTVLHVAAYSCNYEFVKNLVEMMTPNQVAVVDVHGNTALHYAACTAVVGVAEALLKINPDLTEVRGSQGFIPVLSAVVYGAAEGKEMVRYLTKNHRSID